jgi:hypothetical protein
MHDDELFPLNAVPSQVGRAIVREFEGRCPSIREVERISDRQWLAVPGIGPTVLECIRQVTEGQLRRTDRPSSSGLTDAELLERLRSIQAELGSISQLLRRRADTNAIRPVRPSAVAERSGDFAA